MTDRPPQPLPANPRPMPPQPKTSDQARQQAVLLRLLEDKRHADAALLPQQTADDRQSQLMASDVKYLSEILQGFGQRERLASNADCAGSKSFADSPK